MLKVPFDNDGFVRYHKNRLTGDMTSYEVSALYAGESRRGIVLGSVEHNRWKSAVEVKASGDSRVEEMCIRDRYATVLVLPFCFMFLLEQRFNTR